MKKRSFDLDEFGEVTCDIDMLMESRMLVTANSGGGKSFVLRRILEQTHGHVQQIVLDPEGEFASLREKHGFVHAAATGGDCIAHPKSAALLAEKLLKTGVSAILDIYELKAHERTRFVRLFLEALMDAPRALWHPVLVVVDEAHVYCPENTKAESKAAVIDLACRGRKRGFNALLATQRLAKLDKDAAAECNNQLIGRCVYEGDVKRAANDLGFTKVQWPELRTLRPGNFFVVGPAFNTDVIGTVKVGPVRTTHPKAGSRIAFKPAPATAAIRALLPQFADLPAEAEKQTQTVEELRSEIAKLKRELAAKPAAKTERIEVPVLSTEVIDDLGKVAREMASLTSAITGAVDSVLKSRRDEARDRAKPAFFPSMGLYGEPRVPRTARPAAPLPTVAQNNTSQKLPSGEHKVLTVVAQYGIEGVGRVQVSVLTGFKTSTRNAYLYRLSAAGLVSGESIFVVTQSGIEALGDDFKPLPTGDELRDYWRMNLPVGERIIFDEVVDAYPSPIGRDKIGTSFALSTKNAYLHRLSAKRLVLPSGRGSVIATATLFGDR